MVNRLKNLGPQYKEVLSYASAIARTCGCRIYLVGGVVRDLFLARTTFDLDVVVEGNAITFAQTLARQLKCTFKKHHSFGTATIFFGEYTIDFATARCESYPHWGALPRVKRSCVCDDLFRRDFTINSMAISLNKDDYGKLIDPCGGLHDLGKGVIRIHHPESFLEDPTRILRAIRFQKRFSFRLATATMRSLHEAVSLDALDLVHPHRLRNELILILNEPAPVGVIKKLEKLCGLGFFEPTLMLSKETIVLFFSLKRAVDWYKKRYPQHRLGDAWVMYLAALLLGFTKPRIKRFFQRFALRKGDLAQVLSMKENVGKLAALERALPPSAIYRKLSPLSLETALFLYAYSHSSRSRRAIRYFFDNLVGIRLSIGGEDIKKLGVNPHRVYRKLFDRLLAIKMDGGITTKKEELREAKRLLQRWGL